MNSQSFSEEENDHEKLEIKEEKLHSPVTLNKMELVENDKDCHSLDNKENTDTLASIQTYAQRIKSFLGWELDENQQQNEAVDVEMEAVDGNTTQNLIVSDAETYNKNEEIIEEKMNCSSVEETDKNKSENEINYPENGGSLMRVPIDENADNLNEENEDYLNQSVHDNDIKQCLILEKEKLAVDLENKDNVHNNFDDKKDSLENPNKTVDASEVSIAETGETENIVSIIELDSSNTGTSNILDEDEGFLTKENTNNTGMIEITSDMDILCGISPEKDRFAHSLAYEKDAYSDDINKDTECNELISTNSRKEVVGNELECENGENVNFENDDENITFKIKEKKEFDSKEDFNMKLKDISPPECLTDDKGSEKNENNDADDHKSEDSLDLDEDLPLDSKLPNQYVREIRRLSKGIVKEVIESARNSVHELYSSQGENLNSTSLSENLRNYDQVKDNEDFYFNNGGQEENERAEFNKNVGNILNSKNDHSVKEWDTECNETVCGFGCFKPKWIQKYATSRVYLALFSLIGVIHGCYYTYVVSILSTLEKRYAFKTKVSGTLLLADEITPLILGILVGYIGGKTHRPRMVAIGMFMSAACCFVSGLPYLLYGTPNNVSYVNGKIKIGPKFCGSDRNSTLCDSGDQPPTLSVVGIFLFASFLKGFATLSFYVIGMSYMDDIIKRKNSSMYFAISLALRLLGPLLGFLMSSGFLKYYENPLYDPGFGPDDPRWIGAWWIGFFLQGILLVIFTIPIALFPRRLPGQKKVEKVVALPEENGMKKIFTGLISALKRLGKNPVFIVLIINTNMKVFGHFGHAIMLPKYMENQFRLSASEASLYSGAVSILCIIISTILGGFLIWKYRPQIKALLLGMIVSEIILCIGFLILMIPRCQTSEMLHFGMDEDGLILNSVCNRNCDCSTSAFTPFCGPDSKTLYFSPCYAGCTLEMNSSLSSKANKEFGNCSCVDQLQIGATISEGFCPDENCRGQMIAYLIILFIMVTVSNLFTVAATMILLRSVHPSDKSIALGTFETFICLFGFIPFPVTFGALVDSACLVWEKSCGETGNCWFYDMDKYNYLLHGVSSLFSSFSVVCLITLYFLSHRVRNLYVEEEEELRQEDPSKYVDIKLDTVSGSVTKL